MAGAATWQGKDEEGGVRLDHRPLMCRFSGVRWTFAHVCGWVVVARRWPWVGGCKLDEQGTSAYQVLCQFRNLGNRSQTFAITPAPTAPRSRAQGRTQFPIIVRGKGGGGTRVWGCVPAALNTTLSNQAVTVVATELCSFFTLFAAAVFVVGKACRADPWFLLRGRYAFGFINKRLVIAFWIVGDLGSGLEPRRVGALVGGGAGGLAVVLQQQHCTGFVL